jgi:acyl-CoA thioesterase I
MQVRSRVTYEIARHEVFAVPKGPRRPSAAMQLRVLWIALASVAVAFPASAQVVCLGASNTAGKTVSAQDAYPAQLEAMLRAKGYTGHVDNEGMSGDTTAGMLSRLDRAVPVGTRVVLLQPGGNDSRRGVPGEREGNVAQIVERLKARQIAVVMVENNMFGALIRQGYGSDGTHLTATGYHQLAAELLPEVERALGLLAN